jgi:methylglyoxal synthase
LFLHFVPFSLNFTKILCRSSYIEFALCAVAETGSGELRSGSQVSAQLAAERTELLVFSFRPLLSRGAEIG